MLPYLAIPDIIMQGQDGLRRCRTDPETALIPVTAGAVHHMSSSAQSLPRVRPSIRLPGTTWDKASAGDRRGATLGREPLISALAQPNGSDGQERR
ncbi:hypothetical protein ABZS66_20915 [Dactylosporangium sp. NPDC005572]|uniref:hypothetical protein n=1 Tax=Dactylosporangium sp. NPDC005572 TaxID=3156889 RepID=UPI0033B76C26